MQGITPTKMGPTPIRTKCYYDILSYMGFEKHPSHMQNSLDSQIECELSSFTGKGKKKKKRTNWWRPRSNPSPDHQLFVQNL